MQTTKARKFVCLNSAVKSEVCQFGCKVNGDIFRFTCLQIISNDVTSFHSAYFAVDGVKKTCFLPGFHLQIVVHYEKRTEYGSF